MIEGYADVDNFGNITYHPQDTQIVRVDRELFEQLVELWKEKNVRLEVHYPFYETFDGKRFTGCHICSTDDDLVAWPCSFVERAETP